VLPLEVTLQNLRILRCELGLTQITLARLSGVSRMRLQLAESGDLELRQEEIEAIRRTLKQRVKERADRLKSLSSLRPALMLTAAHEI
jgi:predicted transcriptional regulator